MSRLGKPGALRRIEYGVVCVQNGGQPRVGDVFRPLALARARARVTTTTTINLIWYSTVLVLYCSPRTCCARVHLVRVLCAARAAHKIILCVARVTHGYNVRRARGAHSFARRGRVGWQFSVVRLILCATRAAHGAHPFAVARAAIHQAAGVLRPIVNAAVLVYKSRRLERLYEINGASRPAAGAGDDAGRENVQIAVLGVCQRPHPKAHHQAHRRIIVDVEGVRKGAGFAVIPQGFIYLNPCHFDLFPSHLVSLREAMLCRSAGSEANHSARMAEAAQFERQRNMPAEAREQAIAQGARRTPPGRSAPRYARAKQCSSQLCHRQASPCLAIAGLCQPSPLFCPSGRCASQLSRCQSMQSRLISAFANPSAANQSLCSSPHICAHANRLSDRPICSIASLFPSRQIPAVQRLAAASQSIALVAIQCPRVAYPSNADPISALANLGLPILCHSRLCNASAIHCTSIPWRFRRYPILSAHCLSVARAKQGDALPLPFCSLLCRRNSAPCISFASRLIGATPCVAFAWQSCSQPLQGGAMLFHRRSSLFFAVATPDTSLPLRRIAVLCHSRAQIRGSQLCPFTSPRINGNRRLSRALPGKKTSLPRIHPAPQS